MGLPFVGVKSATARASVAPGHRAFFAKFFRRFPGGGGCMRREIAWPKLGSLSAVLAAVLGKDKLRIGLTVARGDRQRERNGAGRAHRADPASATCEAVPALDPVTLTGSADFPCSLAAALRLASNCASVLGARHGLTPMRHGHDEHRNAMHLRTSSEEPAQQSRQCARIAAIGDIGS
jgi:hypothetical protein